MVPIDRTRLRLVEVALALSVLAIVALIFAQQPLPWPPWPTVAGVAVNPELWIPGLLALVALFGAAADGIGVGPAAVALLSLPTALFAALSVLTLTFGSGGGVFWGGFVTLVVATPLALVVVGRAAVHELRRRDTPDTGRSADG